MDNYKFEVICKNAIIDYFNKHADKTDNAKLTIKDVFVVWICKTLKNNKALLSTTISDGLYYECTYNGEKEEMYIDVYKKWENYVVSKENFNEKVGV
jgi:hypothetical protein